LDKGLPSQLTRSRVQYAWLFITLLLIAGWPLVRTMWFSLTDASLSNLEGYRFPFYGMTLVGGKPFAIPCYSLLFP